VSERGNRWQSSVRTFGPVGRAVASLAVLGVLYWYLQLGLFGLVGALIWGGTVLPWALRDIWRRAVLPETDLTRLRDQAARAAERLNDPPRSHLAFDPENPPPSRW
jgi:hypothetical protein